MTRVLLSIMPVGEPCRACGEGRDHPGLVLGPAVVVAEGVSAGVVAAATAARHRRVQGLPLERGKIVSTKVIFVV